MFQEIENRTFHEFVRDFDQNDIHNTQVRWISGDINGSGPDLLEKALHNVEQHFIFIGYQELYNESLLLLSKKLGWSIPYYRFQNKGSYKKEKLIEAKTLDIIRQKNEADYLLYSQLKERFEKQLNDLSYLQLKLLQLQLTNRLYSSTKLKKLSKRFRG
jgi:hypothetical protein